MTRTGKVNRLNNMQPEALLEIHPMDAKDMNIKDSELYALNSRRGHLTVHVKETDRIRRGTVFLPMHWGFTQTNHCETNNLMHEQSCRISKQPELKASAIIVAPVHPVNQPIENDKQGFVKYVKEIVNMQ